MKSLVSTLLMHPVLIAGSPTGNQFKGAGTNNEMKILSIAILLLLKVTFLPSVSLLFYMAVAIILDFVSGIVKAKVLRQVRTSSGYRRSVIKFLQYGGSIAIGLVLANAGEGTTADSFKAMLSYFNDGLILFIIYIEVTSVFENLYAVDNKTLMSRYFIAPVLKILTWQIKNNPVIMQAENNKNKEEENLPANNPRD